MKILASLAAAGVALTLSFSAAAQFNSPAEAVKFRKDTLSEMNKNFRPLGAMANGRAPFDAKLAQEHAAAVEELSKKPWAAFTPDTDGVGGTKARPEIWMDNAKFKQASETLMAQTAKLNVAAKTGDLEQLKAAVSNTAASCKACHDNFRN